MRKRILGYGLLLVALLAIVLACTSCSHLTVSPKPVEAKVVAIGSTNKQDADVIDGDATGLLVRSAWVVKYHALETKWKETGAPGDDRIVPDAGNYRVPYIVSDHMADMMRRERLAAAGP